MSTQKVTIQDIAKEADAPVVEVMRVIFGQNNLGNDVHNRIYRAMEHLDYVSIAPGVQKATGQIGLIAPTVKESDYFRGIFEGISNSANAHGYGISVSLHNDAVRQNLNAIFSDDKIHGVIIVVPEALDEIVEYSRASDKPFVLVDYNGDDDISNIPTVSVNNRQAMVQATQHLINLGHERIGFVTGRMQLISAQERLAGYREALNDAGIAYDADLVTHGDWMRPSGEVAGHALLSRAVPPTAVIASNDLMALGVMTVALEQGLHVPQDLSIIGFDDIPLVSSISPTLTTIRQPLIEIGKAAFNLIKDVANGKAPDNLNVELSTEFVLRESTARANR
ncbi:MAG: LacI family DNA-binding transcriptional regulator [Aggregatilineales bacterium]